MLCTASCTLFTSHTNSSHITHHAYEHITHHISCISQITHHAYHKSCISHHAHHRSHIMHVTDRIPCISLCNARHKPTAHQGPACLPSENTCHISHILCPLQLGRIVGCSAGQSLAYVSTLTVLCSTAVHVYRHTPPPRPSCQVTTWPSCCASSSSSTPPAHPNQETQP